MIDYQGSIPNEAHATALGRWDNVITELDEKIDYWSKHIALMEGSDEMDSDSDDDDDGEN